MQVLIHLHAFSRATSELNDEKVQIRRKLNAIVSSDLHGELNLNVRR